MHHHPAVDPELIRRLLAVIEGWGEHPRPVDRERPHGITGSPPADDQAASFAARMGKLAAARTRK